jgi:uncharacterized repeat protein (TIGR02543 family)
MITFVLFLSSCNDSSIEEDKDQLQDDLVKDEQTTEDYNDAQDDASDNQDEGEQIDMVVVSFVDFDGTVIKTQTISKDEQPSEPSNPTRAGYNFTGWDHERQSFTEDITITALYEKVMFDEQLLSQFDGKDGADAYIAYEGVVYDVTKSNRWRNGVHNGYSAGADLTYELNTYAPHSAGELTKFPIVGFYE